MLNTEMELTELVSKRFLSLLQSIDLFCDHLLNEEELFAWMDNGGNPVSYKIARLIAANTFKQIEYEDDQDPRSIVIAPGIIAASKELIVIAEQMNKAKDDFKEAIKLIKSKKEVNKENLHKFINNSLNTRNQNTAKILKRNGLTRLHLKQCYRKIPIVNEAPAKISWTWANTRSIKKISKFEAEKMLLEKRKDFGIEQQIKKLYTIADNELLAIVQDLAPHLRANLVFKKDKKIIGRKMVKGPVPILFLDEYQIGNLEIRPPKEKTSRDNKRHIRNDQKIIPEVFLPAIRAHRYRS